MGEAGWVGATGDATAAAKTQVGVVCAAVAMVAAVAPLEAAGKVVAAQAAMRVVRAVGREAAWEVRLVSQHGPQRSFRQDQDSSR